MSSLGITVLGSTGSIGRNTLDVVSRHPGRYHVTALGAHRNTKLLAEQCVHHQPRYAVIAEEGKATELSAELKRLECSTEVLAGADALCEVAGMTETDVLMAAIVGAAGLASTLEAVKAGKRLLLANKESMVIAGELFRSTAKKSGATIIPVDSEHNALFQALPVNFTDGLSSVGVERLILTASGGPFLHRERSSLQSITPEQACNHPNWNMGRKISVDSATLMNKGLEVIEARWLFDAHPDEIEVVIHPQSIVHSMVAYADGSVLAQMGVPDMRTPIAHALAYPERIESGVNRLNLTEVRKLEFFSPDLESFPGLGLAFEVLRNGGNAPVIFNAANEVAVEAFLDQRIEFLRIPTIVMKALESCPGGAVKELQDVVEFDRMAREVTNRIVAKERGI